MQLQNTTKTKGHCTSQLERKDRLPGRGATFRPAATSQQNNRTQMKPAMSLYDGTDFSESKKLNPKERIWYPKAGKQCTRALSLSRVRLYATPWTVAHQAPLFMGFSRQEYWSGLPCPPSGDFPDPGIKPASLASPELTGGFFTTRATWEAITQFSSVAQSCPTLCSPMDCSTSGFPVHHQLLEPTQTHPLRLWCYPNISSSVVPFSRLQSFLASGSFGGYVSLK